MKTWKKVKIAGKKNIDVSECLSTIHSKGIGMDHRTWDFLGSLKRDYCYSPQHYCEHTDTLNLVLLDLEEVGLTEKGCAINLKYELNGIENHLKKIGLEPVPPATILSLLSQTNIQQNQEEEFLFFSNPPFRDIYESRFLPLFKKNSIYMLQLNSCFITSRTKIVAMKPATEILPTFDVWKHVQVGADNDEINKMISLVRKNGCEIDEDKRVTKMLFSRSNQDVAKSTAQLVKVEIGDLWTEINCDRVGYQHILSRAKELGLKPCPPEVGLQILIQNPKISCNQWLNIGMDPVDGSILCIYPITSCRRVPELSGSNGCWDDDDEDCALMITQWIFIKE